MIEGLTGTCCWFVVVTHRSCMARLASVLFDLPAFCLLAAASRKSRLARGVEMEKAPPESQRQTARQREGIIFDANLYLGIGPAGAASAKKKLRLQGAESARDGLQHSGCENTWGEEGAS